MAAIRPWTDAETESLVRLYPDHHAHDIQRIALPDRSACAIWKRACKLGLRTTTFQKVGGWTSAEIEALRTAWPNGVAAAEAALPGRSRHAIIHKGHNLDLPPLRSPDWTGKEILTLRRIYATGSFGDAVEALGRSRSAVANMAYKLRLKAARRAPFRSLRREDASGRFWTDRELALLTALYRNGTPMALIRGNLPRRSPAAIDSQIRWLGLRRPTKRQEAA